MDDRDRIRRALSRGHLIDITTTGRRTGRPRRIELVFHNFDGRIYISGRPFIGRKRSWVANLEADRHMTFHLKGPVRADLPAFGRPITDETERREVLRRVVQVWRGMDLETMVVASPLVEVTFEEPGLTGEALATTVRRS
jgi:deazaflavin-dependent oxidoreductase (nitroreductase family)